MLGLKELYRRLKHNRGFGVQSPAAFFLVTHVLRNKMPYYIYPQLDNVATTTDEHSAEHCRRLFRLTNYIQPTSSIIFASGAGSAACAVAAGKKHIPCHALTDGNTTHPAAKQFLHGTDCHILTGNQQKNLERLLAEHGRLGLLHVGKTDKYAAAVDTALRYADHRSAIIVEGISRNREISEWWNNIKEHPDVIITFDLQSMGIMFFDTSYKKQHYTLKLK